MQGDERDPQVELVRRYARILRSAPAEAMRAWSPPAPQRAPGLAAAPIRFARDARERAARPASPRS